MNRDELVTEIADILAIIDADTDKPLVAKEIRKPLAHRLLSLIDAERCVWTSDEDEHRADTGCGKELWHTTPFDKEYTPFCPCCGKRIEVKEV